MRITDYYARGVPTMSFEFFPPKTAEAEEALFRDTMPALERLHPAYISVTYGAGGGTRDTTLRVVQRIRDDHGIEAMAHVTCVGSTRESIAGVLDEAWGLGIHNILALRGDPPRGQKTFQPQPGGFAYASELVPYVKSRHSFTVGGAFYPEGHIECPDKLLDWDRTAAKVAAGADFLISQLFYDVEKYLACEDYLRNKRGVKVPLIPGVLPFLSAEQVRRFTSFCGAKIPDAVGRRLEALAADDESVRKLGVEVCTDICRRLLDHGVPGIHIYCLNRAASSRELLLNLGLV